MNRRKFISQSGAGAAAAVAALTAGELAHSTQPVSAQGQKRALMKAGATVRCTDEELKSVARYGVTQIVSPPPIAEEGRLYATVDELKGMHDIADRNGATVYLLTPPNLASSHIDRERNPGIMLGKSPERDREIEAVQTMIKNCAAAGIPAIKYNLSILGVLRSGTIPGRGDSTYTSFKLADAKPNPPVTRAGVVTKDMYWERITYFLDHVIPVANEYKVRMALHPNDSMTPPEGYQGVHAVLDTVEGLKKFVSIQESPYHGLNFCQGTISEMLQNPGQEIFDVIRYFGSRKKIFNVHFRNIMGNRQEFAEVAPDAGVVNMAKAMLTYKEVGYDGVLHPDHVVRAPNDPGGDQYTAFVYGYIKALIQLADITNT
jgi:mannonate dehydratase